MIAGPNLPVVQTDQRSRQITLIISKSEDEPRAEVDGYEVTCEGEGCDPPHKPLDANVDPVTHTYNDLTPFTRYTFRVRAIRQGKYSAEVTREADTKEAGKSYVLQQSITKSNAMQIF